LASTISREPVFRSEPSSAALCVVSEGELALIDLFFDSADLVDTRRYVQGHPWVFELLIESVAHVSRVFGPQSRVTLELVSDPSAPADEELFALIPCSLGGQVGRELLRNLDTSWWLNASTRSHNDLIFDIKLG